MRGCNNYCAYCIVPYTRGPERSRPADDILKEIGDMAAAGFREITLLGQNVNSYHDGKVDFAGLLRAASRVERIVRIRFMTSHPKDLSLSVLEAVAEESVLCNHIHLPVQAGSNRILKAMNRRYTREHYIRLVEQARTLIPDVAVTTDIIVGFPGESESDFMDTVDLIKTLAFDDAFTYHYSPRSGTAAYGMKDNVPREVKLARLDRIIKLQREITAKKKKALIGRTMTVMPERTSKESSLEWMGRTATDHVVVFPKASSTPGIPVRVQINSCRGYTLRGRIAS